LGDKRRDRLPSDTLNSQIPVEMLPVKSVNINPPELLILFFAPSGTRLEPETSYAKQSDQSDHPAILLERGSSTWFLMGPPKFWRSHK